MDINVPEKDNRFAPANLVPVEEVQVYNHGYSDEDVKRIKEAKVAIEKRNLKDNPVTLDEFQNIIVPWNRIHRTEVFNLNFKAEKVKKEKVIKEKVVKVKPVKEKKMTKKEIARRMEDILFAMGTGKPISEEDKAFFDAELARTGKLT